VSALAETWAVDPDDLADAALEAKRCECVDPLVDGGMECLICGRDIRAPGSLSRDFRTAAYMRRLSWAAGLGLARRTGFRGLSYELGENPELTELDAALTPADDDPLLGRLEPLVAVAA